MQKFAYYALYLGEYWQKLLSKIVHFGTLNFSWKKFELMQKKVSKQKSVFDLLKVQNMTKSYPRTWGSFFILYFSKDCIFVYQIWIFCQFLSLVAFPLYSTIAHWSAQTWAASARSSSHVKVGIQSALVFHNSSTRRLFRRSSISFWLGISERPSILRWRL